MTLDLTTKCKLRNNSRQELEKNIEKVKELLRGVKEKTAVLEPFASDAQKETLNKVDSFTQQVDSFQSEASLFFFSLSLFPHFHFTALHLLIAARFAIFHYSSRSRKK